MRENLARVREQISSSVEILAVTKFQPIEKVREAIEAGITHLGNNYAQEGEALMNALPASPNGAPLQWHFIGHIQSRKLKYLPAYRCVQSLDRLELAASLEDRLAAVGTRLEILVEINIGAESQKSGISISDLEVWLEASRKWKHLVLKGLMTMPPPLELEARRPYFRQVRSLFDAHRQKYSLEVLSMGTSADYAIAVEEGSTMIRLGETLFGARPPRGA